MSRENPLLEISTFEIDDGELIGRRPEDVPPEILAQNLEDKFQPCSSTQILEELYTLIEHTDEDLSNCIFNTNHASNYLSLKGELGKDKKEFLSRIEAGIKDPAVRRPEYMRGL